jgi:hypothetical protein
MFAMKAQASHARFPALHANLAIEFLLCQSGSDISHRKRDCAENIQPGGLLIMDSVAWTSSSLQEEQPAEAELADSGSGTCHVWRPNRVTR